MDIIKGEKRRVGVLVRNTKEYDFNITSANYELYDKDYNLIDSYDAVIEDSKIYTVLDTDDLEENTLYYLYFNIYIEYNNKRLMQKFDIYVKR